MRALRWVGLSVAKVVFTVALLVAVWLLFALVYEHGSWWKPLSGWWIGAAVSTVLLLGKSVPGFFRWLGERLELRQARHEL